MRKKPVQQRSRLMVESIIDAAARVVAEEGMTALTMNRVADVAGISNGSLYQYFHDRQDLLEALVERTSSDLMALFNERLPQLEVQVTDLRLVLRFALKLVLDHMRSRPLYLELVRHWGELPLHVFLEPMERFWLNRAQQLMVRYPAQFSRADAQARLYIVFNSAFFNLLRYASEPSPYIREEELLDALTDTIVTTMATAPGVEGVR